MNIYNKRLTNKMFERMNNAWKDEQLRSSLVFYTISLKQILSLTQSLWCFETCGHLLFRIKWSTRTKTKQSRSCSTNYSMSLSLFLTQNEWIKNILTLIVFFWKKFFFFFSWMRDYETYTLLNRYFVSVITVIHRLTDSIIK